MEPPKVSIITPTFDRQAFLPAIAACVRAQSYPSIEWLILDDSERPLAEPMEVCGEKARYFHSGQRLSVGEKRNRLLEASDGDIIVHFDDDDFYGVNYVNNAVTFLKKNNLDVALSRGFFVAHLNVPAFGYYRTLVKKGPGFAFNKNGVRAVSLSQLKIPFIHLCYGWTYVYRRKVWDTIKFKEISVFEDREFINEARGHFGIGGYESVTVDCIHSIHERSSSQCFPQFLLPDFVFRTLSPEAHRHVSRLKQIAANGLSANPPVTA